MSYLVCFLLFLFAAMAASAPPSYFTAFLWAAGGCGRNFVMVPLDMKPRNKNIQTVFALALTWVLWDINVKSGRMNLLSDGYSTEKSCLMGRMGLAVIPNQILNCFPTDVDPRQYRQLIARCARLGKSAQFSTKECI